MLASSPSSSFAASSLPPAAPLAAQAGAPTVASGAVSLSQRLSIQSFFEQAPPAATLASGRPSAQPAATLAQPTLASRPSQPVASLPALSSRVPAGWPFLQPQALPLERVGAAPAAADNVAVRGGSETARPSYTLRHGLGLGCGVRVRLWPTHGEMALPCA